MKYIFVEYYKYAFTLKLKNGKTIRNLDQDGDSIYRLGISNSGEATEQPDGSYLVDGYTFE